MTNLRKAYEWFCDKVYRVLPSSLWVAVILLVLKTAQIYKAGTDQALRDTIPFIGTIVACLAAIAALNALSITRESLELTRNSQRPFLSVAGWQLIRLENSIVVIRLYILNSGILPASNMNAQIEFFAENELVELGNSSNVYEAREWTGDNYTVVFPGGNITKEIYLDQNDVKDKQILADILAHRKIKIRTRVKYKSNIKGRIFDHETLTTVELRTSEHNKVEFFSIPLQEWT